MLWNGGAIDLAANWSVAGWKLRTVLVALVTGLALINAAGVFGKLVEPRVASAGRSGGFFIRSFFNSRGRSTLSSY
jgi:hypothetical protein